MLVTITLILALCAFVFAAMNFQGKFGTFLASGLALGVLALLVQRLMPMINP
jgi:hypothetical protein